MIGVEPPSVADVNNMAELTEVHQTLFRGNVMIVEGLANLDQLTTDEVEFIALPLRIVGGDGCPVRAIAIELSSDCTCSGQSSCVTSRPPVCTFCRGFAISFCHTERSHMTHYRIAGLPGDGIGPEVFEAAQQILDAVQSRCTSLKLAITEYDAGAERYRRVGEAISADVLQCCVDADAVLLAAIGLPDVRKPDGTEVQPDHDDGAASRDWDCTPPYVP